MTFSDGDVTIRYGENSCHNHPERAGRELCVHCGKWYCADCMSATHKYLCAACAESAIAANETFERNITPRRKSRVPLLMGIAGVALICAWLKKPLVILPVAFLLVAIFGKSREINVFKKPRDTKKYSRKAPLVTEEQLATLLRLGGGVVTAKKLASSTGVTIEDAKQFLNNMAVEGMLEVEAGDTELLYKKN